MLLIPAYIITLLPLLISQGVAYVSMHVTHDVHEKRIHELEEKQAGNVAIDYTAWCNRAVVSQDSLNTLMGIDMKIGRAHV